MPKPSIRQKYLDSYAEPEAQRLSAALKHADVPLLPSKGAMCFFSLVIYDEPIDDLAKFLAMPPADALLSVWVFNAPEGGDAQARERTQTAFEYFVQHCSAVSLGEGMYGAFIDGASNADEVNSSSQTSSTSRRNYLILVDRCTVARVLPKQHAVGSARKIGADISVAYASMCACSSAKDSEKGNKEGSKEGCKEGSKEDCAIWFSDADASLPDDYFQADLGHNSALALPFEHKANSDVALESALYDFRLRYYAEQLYTINSPYAYHALGATIVVSLDDYCRVRGVPKKAGGEDFYLLNKLAKLKGVSVPDAPIVTVRGRPSARVPFGTGPAIIEMQKSKNILDSYGYYHPQSFIVLGKLLGVVNDSATLHRTDESVSAIDSYVRSEEMLFKVLRSLAYERFIAHCFKQKLTGEHLKRAFHEWFDAFATRRFIHSYCGMVYPDATLMNLDAQLSDLSEALQARRTKILARWGQC